jgi:hypothetical protein
MLAFARGIFYESVELIYTHCLHCRSASFQICGEIGLVDVSKGCCKAEKVSGKASERQEGLETK